MRFIVSAIMAITLSAACGGGFRQYDFSESEKELFADDVNVPNVEITNTTDVSSVSPLKVSFKASDDESGLQKVVFKNVNTGDSKIVDDFEKGRKIFSGDVLVPLESGVENVITAVAHDRAGNYSSAVTYTVRHNFTSGNDVDRPTVNVPATLICTTSPCQLTITASDVGSGVTMVRWTTSGENGTASRGTGNEWMALVPLTGQTIVVTTVAYDAAGLASSAGTTIITYNPGGGGGGGTGVARTFKAKPGHHLRYAKGVTVDHTKLQSTGRMCIVGEWVENVSNQTVTVEAGMKVQLTCCSNTENRCTANYDSWCWEENPFSQPNCGSGAVIDCNGNSAVMCQ